MKNKEFSIYDNPRGIGRRKFIAACGACTACLATLPMKNLGAFSIRKKPDKMRIRVIYSLHAEKQLQPDWPNVGFDFVPFMEHVNALLASKLPEYEFIPSLANGPDEAVKLLKADESRKIDGYLIYQLNCWNQVVQTIAGSGKPVLYADFQFGGSGGFLVYNANFLGNPSSNIGFVSSSDLNHLVDAVKCFDVIGKGGTMADFVLATEKARLKNTPQPGDLTCLPDSVDTLSTSDCIRLMKKSRILVIRDTGSAQLMPFMNMPVEQIPFSALNQAYNLADRDEAREIAKGWIVQATEVKEVPVQTIEDSAAMYLGMKNLLREYDAKAITVNCLGGFYGGHIHAYPCLGFHQLNNEGLVGACEADLESTATMLAITTLTRGRPGYISDPVIDTSKRQIIYAHCVASNKVFGPDGKSNPYSIMTHSEDRQGASVRSNLPVGYMTTTLKVNNDRKEIIFHQAKAIGNDPDDRACRTKLCAEPLGDLEKLFTFWDQWGWHRVTFYGDLKEPVFDLAESLGYKMVEEA